MDDAHNIKNVDLDEMLKKSFWKDILYEIISSMDPWDVDIAELAAMYAKKVEGMREMDFRIPANVVIVSSVLLRMKSQLMSFTEVNNDPDTEEWMEDPALIMDASVMDSDTETPDGNGGLPDSLTVRPNRVPKRRVSAMELISAIQGVLEDRVIRERIKVKNGGKKLIIPLDKDIKELIDETYRKVMEILSNKNEVLFSEIAHGRDEIIPAFISLLHLSNKQKLKLRQEKIFDEIYIHI
ncbi:MAG: hypothetical protein U9Q22_03330 [Candidatus Altiarchaeota archaeon]|nr:hypothetical protein [Candidatus Altiarchaeota archaeon]